MERTLLLLCLVALAAGGAWGEVAKTPVQYLITPPAKPVVVDGQLGEWDMANTPYTISASGENPMNQVWSNDPDNPVKSDADLSGKAALAWDSTWLYIAAQMVDDHLLGVRPDSKLNQGPAGWACDSLMMTISSFRQRMKTNSPFSPTPFLALRYAPTGTNPRGALVATDAILDKRDLYWYLPEGSQWAVRETPEGYNVEAAVPWKGLEYVPAPGEPLFIAFLAGDMDPGEDLNQVGWASHTEQYGSALQMNLRPVFRLTDRRDLLGLVTVSDDELTPRQGLSVRVELDAVTAPARLEKVRIADAGGKTVWERALNVTVPAGHTARELLEVEANKLQKPGQYTVEQIASAGGKSAVLARYAMAVVAAQDAATGAVAQGEIHHAPPDRVARNSLGERGYYRHNWIKSREDYVPYLRKHLEPGLKQAAKSAIQNKSPHGGQQLPRCMAFYQITGDEEYRTLARDIMDYLLDAALEGELAGSNLTTVAMYRYLTWLKDPASPWAPPDAEKRYRAALHKVAAQPGKWLFTEWGSHNRIWTRYAVQKVARQVAEQDGKPVDPRIIEYTDYHDKLIGEVGDTDDASANYHWVFWNAAVAIYFHTGDWQAFLNNRGFQKTLSRYVEMVSPSGACVPFASCSGWPEVGSSMWAYEWMSNLTKQGRYRWTAHRIAEYYYNHLDHRANQYHLPFDTALNNFCLAYLFADDQVPPTPPPAAARITWRHPWLPASEPETEGRPLYRMLMEPNQWIPDKIVLSSGTGPLDMWGLVELLPIAGHGGELPGNIIALMHNDSALLAGQGYYENAPEFQNIMFVEDLEGVVGFQSGLPTTSVPVFVEDRAFTFARIVTEGYQRLPITYTRDLLFNKNGFLVVKDRVLFHRTMKARLGPCYHARNLGPDNGPNWFNSYYDQIYYTGLGLGRGVQAIRNPAWDLLIYFAPREGRRHVVIDRWWDNPYRNSPIQVRQVWSGMAREGEEIVFTSILLPHAPVLRPAELIVPPADSGELPRIDVLADDNGVSGVKVISENATSGRARKETWVILNTTGQANEGALSTDGLLGIITRDGQGNITDRILVNGTRLQFIGVDEAAGARKPEPVPVEYPG
jgi:hypothetical protein